MSSLTLIRGISGSGKSTLARKLKESNSSIFHVETDMFFDDNGHQQYKFDPSKLSEAHQWCFDNARLAYKAGYQVIVSNTFTRKWEMEKYFTIDPNPQIIICQGRFQNTHGVPPDAVARQLARFEY